MKRGPGAEPGLKTWRAPRWSAGRRARPVRVRDRDPLQAGGNAGLHGAGQ